MMTNIDKISAIIFDFDGTLVDTMPIHFRAYREILADFGAAELEPFLATRVPTAPR